MSYPRTTILCSSKCPHVNHCEDPLPLPSDKTKTDAFVPHGGQDERNTAPNEPSTRTMFLLFSMRLHMLFLSNHISLTFVQIAWSSTQGFSIAGTLIFLCKASFVRVWSYMCLCLRLKHLVMTALFTEDGSCEEVCQHGKGRISTFG
jgi:hypothetical protein